MRVLIVAHPDDEILWFNPAYFERIYIAFLGRRDKPELSKKRLTSLSLHPFKDKISIFNLEESGYWKDRSRYQEHTSAKEYLLEKLKHIKGHEKISEIYTHNDVGEYGHSDHILVNKCVYSVFKETHPIWMPYKFIFSVSGFQPGYIQMKSIESDISSFNRIRSIYIRQAAWTWNLEYYPEPLENYYRVY